MKRYKLDEVVGITLLIGLVFVALINIYWLVRPYKILEYHIDEFDMVQDSYEVGEPLSYRMAFTKYNNLEAKTIKVLQDGVYYTFPVIDSMVKKGDYDFITNSTKTPNVPAGEYTIHTTVIYKPNPWRTIKYDMESEPFMITREDCN